MTRRALMLSLCLAMPALADWWNAGSVPAPPPVNGPICVSGCESSSTTSSSNQQRSSSDPAEEARRAAAAAAAEREAQRRAQEAEAEFEQVRAAERRFSRLGGQVRAQAEHLVDVRDRLEQREAKVRSLERALAPLPPQKPSPGERTPLSMKAYCDRLNAEAAARARGLRASEVPPLPGVAAREAAFQEPPVVAPGRFAEALALAKRARPTLQEEAKEDIEAVSWKLIEKRAPLVAKLHEVFESGKENFKAFSEMDTFLVTGAFTHAEDVALTLGGAGGTATPEDNDRLLRSMGRKVNETTSKQLADQARGAIKDKVLDKAPGWFSWGEAP